MTETIEIPKDIGRNDACPCGSGKKYKKCHQRIHELQREAEKKTQQVEALVGEQTNPWELYKVLVQANEDNLVAFYFELLHELGPMRERITSKDELLIAVDASKESMPAASSYTLLRYRLDEPFVHILLAKGHQDPRQDDVQYQVITLLRHEHTADGAVREGISAQGYRIWDVQHHSKPKSEVGSGDISLDVLGFGWRKAA